MTEALDRARLSLEGIASFEVQRISGALDGSGTAFERGFERDALTGAQRHFAMAEVLADLAFHEVRGTLGRARRPDGVHLWSSTLEDQ